MEKVTIPAIGFLVLTFLLGLYFFNSQINKADSQNSSLDYVNSSDNASSSLSTPQPLKQMINSQSQAQAPTQAQSQPQTRGVSTSNNSYNTQTPSSDNLSTQSQNNTNTTTKLSITCSVNPTTSSVGNEVNWRAQAIGGNGSYTYTWAGDTPLEGSAGSSAAVTYPSAGLKQGTVTVKSGADEASCSKTINIE